MMRQVSEALPCFGLGEEGLIGVSKLRSSYTKKDDG